MATRKYSKNKLIHRPKHKKIRLRKNIKGFRRDEYFQKRCDSFKEGYDYPSKHTAER